ncbi:MAG: PadR family transcriptional regulator [Chloroflexota bacterium]
MTGSKPHHIGTLSPEMALIGQLFDKPGHGYDLHRRVLADLGQVWHLSQSQAYATLKRLEARGMITSEEVKQSKLPSRQLLRLTEQGRQRFLEWLEKPTSGSTRAIRMEFVTRLYFLRQYMPERLPEAFNRQRNEALENIQRLETTVANIPAGQVFNRMSMEMRLEQLKTLLTWLTDSEKYFDQS